MWTAPREPNRTGDDEEEAAYDEEEAAYAIHFKIVRVIFFGIAQVALTNDTGLLHWWQALPVSVASAYALTRALQWLMRNGYIEWE